MYKNWNDTALIFTYSKINGMNCFILQLNELKLVQFAKKYHPFKSLKSKPAFITAAFKAHEKPSSQADFSEYFFCDQKCPTVYCIM